MVLSGLLFRNDRYDKFVPCFESEILFFKNKVVQPTCIFDNNKQLLNSYVNYNVIIIYIILIIILVSKILNNLVFTLILNFESLTSFTK